MKHVVCINDDWTDGYGPRKNDIVEVSRGRVGDVDKPITKMKGSDGYEDDDYDDEEPDDPIRFLEPEYYHCCGCGKTWIQYPGDHPCWEGGCDIGGVG